MSPQTLVKAGNIVEMALADGTLATFVSALRGAGLIERLVGQGQYTVFAPTDDAFKEYAQQTLNEIFSNKEELTALVSYHIVPGKFVASYFSSRAALVTLLGRELIIDRSVILTPDIECSNGVIHVIDTVLLPG
jgi:uncharacterized surface protein with fasciclin (FAS1) repeats